MPGEKQRKGHEKLKTDEEATAGNLCCKIDKKTIKDSLKSKKLQTFMTSLIHGGEKKKRTGDKIQAGRARVKRKKW